MCCGTYHEYIWVFVRVHVPKPLYTITKCTSLLRFRKLCLPPAYILRLKILSTKNVRITSLIVCEFIWINTNLGSTNGHVMLTWSVRMYGQIFHEVYVMMTKENCYCSVNHLNLTAYPRHRRRDRQYLFYRLLRRMMLVIRA